MPKCFKLQQFFEVAFATSAEQRYTNTNRRVKFLRLYVRSTAGGKFRPNAFALSVQCFLYIGFCVTNNNYFYQHEGTDVYRMCQDIQAGMCFI